MSLRPPVIEQFRWSLIRVVAYYFRCSCQQFRDMRMMIRGRCFHTMQVTASAPQRGFAPPFK